MYRSGTGSQRDILFSKENIPRLHEEKCGGTSPPHGKAVISLPSGFPEGIF